GGAKTLPPPVRRGSRWASKPGPRCPQRLSQSAPDVLPYPPDLPITGTLPLGGGPAALELAAQRVKQQLRLACFARRDQRRDLVPVGARLIKFGLGLRRVP